MPNSRRFEPFIDGKRHCNKCGELKEQSEFYFHSTDGYYLGTCKVCIQKRVKNNRISKETNEDKEKRLTYHKEYHKRQTNTIEYRTTRNIALCKRLDSEKGFNTNLTRDFVIIALTKPCVYCGYPSTGLDRLDNTKGHTEDNCVPCCKECNNARMDNFSYEEMKILGKTIKEIKDKRFNN